MLIALAALFAAVADVPAGTSAAAAPPAATAPAAKPEKTATADQIVCHTEQVTGSMFPHKICRRKADTDAARADQQRVLRENQHASGPTQH